MPEQRFPTREEFARELERHESRQRRRQRAKQHEHVRRMLVAFGFITAGALVVVMAVLA